MHRQANRACHGPVTVAKLWLKSTLTGNALYKKKKKNRSIGRLAADEAVTSSWVKVTSAAACRLENSSRYSAGDG